MKLACTIVAVGLLAAFPPLADAATHGVTVKSSFFSPNDLVIQPGDTVIWTYFPLEQDCTYGCPPEVLHTVTADDQSFSSGPPAAQFTYQRTFNDPGEILYHCEVHSVAGGDINSSMNGRITVREDMEAEFQINPGLNDAWFNEATIGQGFLISVFPEIRQLFLAWFTYDVTRPPEDVAAFLGEPGHRWLTAQGPFEGDTANLTVFMSEGGVFDSAEPPVSTDPMGVGALTLVFPDCTQGMITYEITSPNVSGSIPIQRISPDNVALCNFLNEQLQAAQ